jgi:hypothetical protein
MDDTAQYLVVRRSAVRVCVIRFFCETTILGFIVFFYAKYSGKAPTESFSYMVPKIWHGYIQRVGKDKTKEKEENKAAKITKCRSKLAFLPLGLV